MSWKANLVIWSVWMLLLWSIKTVNPFTKTGTNEVREVSKYTRYSEPAKANGKENKPKADHLCRGFSDCRGPAAARERWPSGALCQKAVIDCQPQLKMISENGVRSSALCFSPSLSDGWKGKPCHQDWPCSDLFTSTQTPQAHHIMISSLVFLKTTLTDTPVSMLSAVLKISRLHSVCAINNGKREKVPVYLQKQHYSTILY